MISFDFPQLASVIAQLVGVFASLAFTVLVLYLAQSRLSGHANAHIGVASSLFVASVTFVVQRAVLRYYCWDNHFRSPNTNVRPCAGTCHFAAFATVGDRTCFRQHAIYGSRQNAVQGDDCRRWTSHRLRVFYAWRPWALRERLCRLWSFWHRPVVCVTHSLGCRCHASSVGNDPLFCTPL